MYTVLPLHKKGKQGMCICLLLSSKRNKGKKVIKDLYGKGQSRKTGIEKSDLSKSMVLPLEPWILFI